MRKHRLPYLATALVLVLAFPAAFVSADAWWGKGYKAPSWVLANGGSIIRVNIKGGDPDEFKAFMTRGGKYVEVEFGDNMVFDDAKDGTYVITVYDCNRDCAYQERQDKKDKRGNDSKKAAITIVARPGQETRLTYDTKAKTLYRTGSSGGAPAAPPKPQYTAEQLIEFAAQRAEGEKCDVAKTHTALDDQFVFPKKKSSVSSEEQTLTTTTTTSNL